MRSALADIICDVIIGSIHGEMKVSTPDILYYVCANLRVSELLPPLMSTQVAADLNRKQLELCVHGRR
jgi:hypothetical protein